MYTDSHLHLDAFETEGDLREVIERASAVGVTKLVAIGGGPEANRLVVRLAAAYAGQVFGAVGHDRDLAGHGPDTHALAAQLTEPGIVAVGETGLDYHYGRDTVAEQRVLFAEMLALAARCRYPVVVHSRDADDDTVAMLREHASVWEGDSGRLGVLHCFTGRADFAGRLLELDMHISFSGIITFKNAASLREVAAEIPDDRLLIETDAPYLAPAPYRGKRNEPAHLLHVAEAIAKIRNDSLEHIADITSQNAERLFGIRQKGK